MKNKNLVINIIAVAFSALVFIFMALPFFGGMSEYYLFQVVPYCFEIGRIDAILIYLSPVIVLIATLLCLGFGIVNLLGSLNKITSEKLLNASRKVVLITVAILLAYLLLSIIIMFANGILPQAGIILITVSAIAVLVTSILNKKAQQQA